MIFYKSVMYNFILLYLFILYPNVTKGQNIEDGRIRGYIVLDNSWDSVIYLSYIPSFNHMHAMSSDMIIAETVIDSLGNFEFDIGFLPKEDNLYRIHIVKKGDSPTSLVIGGKDENHLFLLANRKSNIKLSATSIHPPFKHTKFLSSYKNKQFQRITDLVYVADSIASESGLSKRQFIEQKTNEELRIIADTISNSLISLYAIYNSDFESNYPLHISYYESYLKKWENIKSTYFNSFRENFPTSSKEIPILFKLTIAILLIASGYFISKIKWKKKSGIENLSVQERKIFELLQQGASNQEISERYNIGISTVKSHVSNIFAKLNVNSRKDVMNIKTR